MGHEQKSYPHTDAHLAKGDWNPIWNQLQEMDPEFLEAYFAFRSVPHRDGPLPAKFKELILIAINAATTHLYGPGVRRRKSYWKPYSSPPSWGFTRVIWLSPF